ncbi:hypothetical protein CL634_11200 [bacterium]|nr:hypothetical protein [bacterium]
MQELGYIGPHCFFVFWTLAPSEVLMVSQTIQRKNAMINANANPTNAANLTTGDTGNIGRTPHAIVQNIVN